MNSRDKLTTSSLLSLKVLSYAVQPWKRLAHATEVTTSKHHSKKAVLYNFVFQRHLGIQDSYVKATIKSYFFVMVFRVGRFICVTGSLITCVDAYTPSYPLGHTESRAMLDLGTGLALTRPFAAVAAPYLATELPWVLVLVHGLFT